MDIISKRNGTIFRDNVSLKMTLSEELIDMGCDENTMVSISLVRDGSKKIIIEKMK